MLIRVVYHFHRWNAVQVGILRRGRYVKGKQIGKAPVVDVVSYIGHAFGLAQRRSCYVAQALRLS